MWVNNNNSSALDLNLHSAVICKLGFHVPLGQALYDVCRVFLVRCYILVCGNGGGVPLNCGALNVALHLPR